MDSGRGKRPPPARVVRRSNRNNNHVITAAAATIYCTRSSYRGNYRANTDCRFGLLIYYYTGGESITILHRSLSVSLSIVLSSPIIDTRVGWFVDRRLQDCSVFNWSQQRSSLLTCSLSSQRVLIVVFSFYLAWSHVSCYVSPCNFPLSALCVGSITAQPLLRSVPRKLPNSVKQGKKTAITSLKII